MAGVYGGHAESTDPFNKSLVRVVGINGSEMRLQWGSAIQFILIMWNVQVASQAHAGPGIDDAGGHHGGFQHRLGAVGLVVAGSSDGGDSTILDQHIAVTNRIAGHRVNDLAMDQKGFTAGSLAQQQEKEGDKCFHHSCPSSMQQR